jgi:hypothetical protein
MRTHLRIARPVSDLSRTERMYCGAFEVQVLARFEDHDGFDGVILGASGMGYHLEFTHCRTHPVVPSPTEEDLLVFYQADRHAWESTCNRLVEHGFVRVPSFNPYWEHSGRTYADADGYRIVLQHGTWKS